MNMYTALVANYIYTMNYKNIAYPLTEFVQFKGFGKKEEARLLNALIPRKSTYNYVPGWKHGTPYWTDIDRIHVGPDNSIRLGGTGDQEGLESGVSQGLKTTVPVCSVRVLADGTLDLLDWFNRIAEFKRQGYTRIIVCPYYPYMPTKFQRTDQDAIDDFRAVANKRTGQKAITDDEIKELIKNRFEDRPLAEATLKAEMIEFVTQLNLGLSTQKIAGLCNAVIRGFKRRGNVESFSRESAQQWVSNWWKRKTNHKEWEDQPYVKEPHLVNAVDTTRTLRFWKQAMIDYVESDGESTFDFVSFNSGATSHAEIDSGNDELDRELRQLQELSVQYAQILAKKSHMGYLKKTWDHIGNVPQKINQETRQVDVGWSGLEA